MEGLRSQLNVTTSWSKVTCWLVLGSVVVLCRHHRCDLEDGLVCCHKRQKDEQWKVYLNLASWLGGRGYRLFGRLVTGELYMTLKVTNVRPWDSPIFRACWLRDYDRVLVLLNTGAASPHDTTIHGCTPLHVELPSLQQACQGSLLKGSCDGSGSGYMRTIDCERSFEQ